MEKQKGDFIQNKLMPVVQKIQENVYVSSITQGMMRAMPILMGSAFIQLFYSLPIDAWQNFLQSIGLYNLLTTVVNICNLYAVYMVLAIGKTLAEKIGLEAFTGAFTSLVCFLIITPLTTIQQEGAWQPSVLINTDYLGAQGIITAIIIALIAPTIYNFFVKKNWTFNLPDSVPHFVADSFKSIPPSILTLIPFIVLRGLFSMTSFGDLTTCIYTLVQTPLQGVGNTFGGHIIIFLVSGLLWWCGVHGTLVIFPILMMIMQPALIENINAVNSGMAAPNLLSFQTFYTVFQFIGGPGCLFGLSVALAFFTKSERYKVQGKLCLIPGFFNIIEPMVYGLPVVLNPILLVPFLATPLVIYTLMYLALKVGLFMTPVVNMGIMVMPGPIVGFLLGGGIGLGIFVLLACVLSTVIYLPFVKVLDKMALKEEKSLAEN